MTDTANMTVRELIAKLAAVSDVDAEVCISLFNGDPIPAISVEETDDNRVTLSNV